MPELKKFANLRASSILESVIALSIISICLFIAVMVYAAVFNERTSVDYYKKRQAANELFFLLHVQQDSVLDKLGDSIEHTVENDLDIFSIRLTDSAIDSSPTYYILQQND